jgi:tetratricopeptide (TPR) repeat protein
MPGAGKILCLLLGLFVLAGAFSACRTGPQRASAQQAEYVGSAACQPCHEELYQAYLQTGKGRSLSRFDPRSAPESLPSPVIPDPKTGFFYQAFLRGDTLYQREFRRDQRGRIYQERIYPVAYVIGSGRATRSYLMEQNGYLTQMPLTWYMQVRRWGLSPGFEEANDRFERKITLECMTCHNDLPQASPFAQNHYSRVPLGIGCERCHGPGGEHVRRRAQGWRPPAGEADPTIVNPARLDRARQLDICQQCHLEGVVTVFSPGEDPTTFRPGQRLAEHRAVFAHEGQLRDPEQFGLASHALRLAQSRCFQRSPMTCTTCHDPHRASADRNPGSFDRFCRSCHAGSGGHAPLCSRVGAAEQGCVSCHMRRSGTADVPHVTFTDHWIRRRVPSPRPGRGRAMITERRPLQLLPIEGVTGGVVPDRWEPAKPEEKLQAALAYWHFYEAFHGLPQYVERVIRWAEEGLRAGAEHPEVRIALARAYTLQGQMPQARQILQQQIQRYPEHAWGWFWFGAVAEAEGRISEAIEAYRRALAQAPYLTEARRKLADALLQAGREAEAEAVLLELIRLEPEHEPRAWYNLGLVRWRTGRSLEAREALQKAVELEPRLLEGWINLGSIWLEENALKQAERCFSIALELDPRSPSALGSMALVRLREGRFEEARRLLEAVLREEPGNQAARMLLGQLGPG